jgi:hypothetical protein
MAGAGGRRGVKAEVVSISTEAPEPEPEAPAPLPPAEAAAQFRQKARVYAGEALEALAALVKDAKSEAVRVSAANALIDRAYGRPAQAGKASGEAEPDDGQGVTWTVEWLEPGK